MVMCLRLTLEFAVECQSKRIEEMEAEEDMEKSH